MGSDESLPENPYFPSDIDPYKSGDYGQHSYIQSLPTNFNHPFTPLIDFDDEIKVPKNIYHSAFGGTWSIKLPESISPICRKGHFCVYSKVLKKLYIGYGVEDSHQPKFLNDVWQFDLSTRKWDRINLKYQGNNNDNTILKKITLRKNSTATISENEMKLYIFGGVNEDREYLSDFHSIDLKTGEVSLIIPSTQLNIENYSTPTEIYSSLSPKARKGAIIQYYNGLIYLWSGLAAGADILNEISVYDIKSNTWATKIFVKPKRLKSNSHSELNTANSSTETLPSLDSWVEGRSNIPWQLVDNHIYAFGGSPKKTLIDIEINPSSSLSQIPAFDSVKTILIREIECIGSAPPENTFYAGMVYIDSPFNIKQFQSNETRVLDNNKTNDLANSNNNVNNNNITGNNTVSSNSNNDTRVTDDSKIIPGRHGLLVYLGGRSYSKYTLIYGLDLSRLWWFVLHVTPDGDTVSYADGKISENGLFMTPRYYNFALGYDEKRREIVACAAHQGLISKTKSHLAHKKRRVTDINDSYTKNKVPNYTPDSNQLGQIETDKSSKSMTRRFSNVIISDEVNTYLVPNYSDNINKKTSTTTSANTSNNNSSHSNLKLNCAFDSSSNYYDGKNDAQLMSPVGCGMGALASGEKLFIYQIGNVLAGLNIKEDLLTMQKLSLSTENEQRQNPIDDGEEKIIDF